MIVENQVNQPTTSANLCKAHTDPTRHAARRTATTATSKYRPGDRWMSGRSSTTTRVQAVTTALPAIDITLISAKATQFPSITDTSRAFELLLNLPLRN